MPLSRHKRLGEHETQPRWISPHKKPQPQQPYKQPSARTPTYTTTPNANAHGSAQKKVHFALPIEQGFRSRDVAEKVCVPTSRAQMKQIPRILAANT
jgi:hypothetical protein